MKKLIPITSPLLALCLATSSSAIEHPPVTKHMATPPTTENASHKSTAKAAAEKLKAKKPESDSMYEEE
jgi:hypothetical protein